MGSFPFHRDLQEIASSQLTKALDPEEFRKQGHMVINFIADYYQNIEKYPVLSRVEPGYLKKCLPESAPYDPEPISTILRDVQNHIVPGLTHWQSPNFFAYFSSTASTAGFLGEILTTGFNVVGFNWVSSPAATELENIVMDWLGDMLQLPKSFHFSGNGGGVLHGSTCEAIVCTMVAARDQMLRRIGSENLGKLVVYGSDQTHSTLQKATQIVGINTENFRAIKTTKSTGFALLPEMLRLTISSDLEKGLVPLFLCATMGTTATTAIDPLEALCHVAKEYSVWVHVDAAYAGSACICPEFRHFINGVEGANSFSFNPHKWLFTGMDCCCLWVKNPSVLASSLSTNPEFLRNKASDSKQVVDYKDWQIALSRRFRALKLWLVIRSYGVANLRNFIRIHVKMAKTFEGLVRMDKRFEILVPRNFSLVCFRISPSALISSNEDDEIGMVNEVNCKLLEAINASGKAYMTHAVVGGLYVLRCAVGATLTEEKHIVEAWNVVQDHAQAILSTY
ncbi:putative pyridoxal phosphate-dependent decarboxylase, pyridoxal phosphate-dependent transferase [Rosa chinensis]|uniref:Phenylacetaldehyde synthase n=2 Tax=Rosa TaxID=3764 RepID=A0A410RAA0_ROSHC|nr:phenylacetaldehyde synthase [Rosa chinensis]PRQ22156.1 putative pyridoxal phosphate-dependent decarboxylase, pyridoxal phosphate-dependent transferase [Rosa chinensis]QAT78106.1 phenylacetaldehyde synthase [Rosa hybrid cultivar]